MGLELQCALCDMLYWAQLTQLTTKTVCSFARGFFCSIPPVEKQLARQIDMIECLFLKRQLTLQAGFFAALGAYCPLAVDGQEVDWMPTWLQEQMSPYGQSLSTTSIKRTLMRIEEAAALYAKYASREATVSRPATP